jgi:MarR family transcriptional regulator for hemolysin
MVSRPSGPPVLPPIGFQLASTAKLLGRAYDEAMAAVGGSAAVWQVLVSVKAEHHGTQRTLAAAVGIEGPTLTHHLNRMEAAGLVTRTRDPENRRVQRVELTAEGEALFRRLRERAFAFDRQLRAGFRDDEVQALSDMLARLRVNATVDDTAEAM